jgi:Holliday junction resolvase RusA-like endonuclease
MGIPRSGTRRIRTPDRPNSFGANVFWVMRDFVESGGVMTERLESVEVFVKGIPYARNKTKGRLQAPAEWTKAVEMQTAVLPLFSEPCELEVEFILPVDKFPLDFPLGMDIDNLVKRLMDALGRTVFRNAPGRDSVVVTLHARKRKAKGGEETGARIRLRIATFE